MFLAPTSKTSKDIDEEDAAGLSHFKVPDGNEDLKVTGPAAKNSKGYVLITDSHSSSNTPVNVPARNTSAAASSGDADGRKETPRKAP